MKFRKFILFISIISLLLVTSCSPSAKIPDGTNDTDNTDTTNTTELADYKFKLSNLPYGSEGLKIYARIRVGENKYSNHLISTVTSCTADAVIEETIQMPKHIDSMYLFFVNEEDEAEYRIKITDEKYLNSATGVYEVDGYYEYYYEYDSEILYSPYIAVNESMFEKLELNKDYTFNYKIKPFIVGYLEKIKGRDIQITIKENQTEGEDKANTKTICKVSLDKTKVMSYSSECDSLYSSSYSTFHCDEDIVYFMIKPQAYDSNLEKEKAEVTLTFSLKIPEEDRCLTIENSCMASDNFLYANGKYYEDKSLKNLYKIDIKLNERFLFHEFAGDISAICEVEQRKLLVSYIVEDEQKKKTTNVAIIDLASGNCSDITTGFEKDVDSILLYKDDQVVLFTETFRDRQDYLYLLNYLTGEYTEVTKKCSSSSFCVPKDAFYLPENDLIVYSQKNTSPKNIAFIRIDNSDVDGPQLYGRSSQYHSDYKMTYPFKLYSTNPLEFINAAGEIFTVKPDIIDSVEPVDEYVQGLLSVTYDNKVKEWCEFKRCLDFTYSDFIACGEYFYIMYVYKLSSLYNNTVVEKHSFANPETVIKTVTIDKEDGIKLWQCGEKLYLQTTYKDYVSVASTSQDMISFHEIDF